jgi:hypothetical protein
MPPCYSGPIPVNDDERLAIWRWAKANGVDLGLPIEKVGDAINTHFFAGQGKPEWITDILSGRKTPFRELSNEAWKRQYNRRQITAQAKDVAGQQAMHPVLRGIQRMWNIPRSAAVFGHGLVFPVTHGGDLALRPKSWGVFMRGLLNTWTKSWSPAATERMLDSMKRQPLFDTALRSGLDVGERSGVNEAFTRKSSVGSRAWSALTAMRFELWNNEMQKYINPDTPHAQVLDIGKNLAEWANHATGSAKGPISNLGGNVLFGPKLVQSKLSRLFSDPVKTIGTFANWNNASAGEKAAAWTRLSGATQYLGTGLGLLAANQGVLWATGQKDKDGKNVQINFTNPMKGDFLAFKGGGLEWSIPGMHSEIRALGKILAVSFENSKEVNPRNESKTALIAQELGNYALGKANPAIGVGKELLTGQDYRGKPLPWVPPKPTKSAKTGKPLKPGLPPYGWSEYLLSHGPIPLQGPIRYVYDQLRAKGASAMDASAVIKGLIMTGVGATGMHISEDYPQAIKRKQAAQHLLAH